VIIFECPDCGGDLEDADGLWWCPECERVVTAAELVREDGDG
jgi:uncharacterized Zn finger protein (UPF0148 family)